LTVTILQTSVEQLSQLGRVGAYTLECVRDINALYRDWHKLESEGTSCIYQRFEWVRIALETIDRNHEPLLITGRDDQGVQFIIPLVLKRGLVNTLHWPGGSHANICSGLYSRSFIKRADANLMKAIFRAIGKITPALTVTRLVNQPFKLGQQQNPLTLLAHQTSVNLMYDMDLEGGINGVLKGKSGAKRKRYYRKQKEAADALGGHELFIPFSKEEIRDAVDEFVGLKTERFEQMGIRNVFEDEDTKSFLTRLACEPERDGVQLFRFMMLKVGGKTRGLYGGAVLGDYFQANVNAISFDEFTNWSPGEMVLYAMVERLSEEGFSRMDLGVGDERYKRSWCQHVHTLFDTIMPLNGISAPVAFAMGLKYRGKAYLRGQQWFWKRFRKFREIKGNLKRKVLG